MLLSVLLLPLPPSPPKPGVAATLAGTDDALRRLVKGFILCNQPAFFFFFFFDALLELTEEE